MANRYSTRSDRGPNREENFGGSRREQNFNEYNRGQDFGKYGRGWRGVEGQGRGWNQEQGGNYRYGGYGSRGRDWGRNRNFDRQGERKWGDDRYGRVDVGRDFMTNQPIRESYGEIDDRSQFGQRFGLYSEPKRDYTERGGYSGADYDNWRSRGLNRDRGFGMDFENRDYDFDTGRTEFDESVAGRPYWGNERDYREGWRAYGSRPGNMGFGDRERPDEWNRSAYGRDRGSFGERARDFFNTGYSSMQYGEYFPRRRDYSWSFDRDRGDYTGAGYYRGDYERDRDRGESFGDKVKNFFGIGPKGYRRSDDRIREDVSERLEDHPLIDASNIEIQVIEGEVTLTGSVDNRRAKRLAEDVTEDVRGVKDVHNQLRVSYTGTGDFGRTGTSFGDLSSGTGTSTTTSSGTTSATGSSNQPSAGTPGSTTSTTKKGTERAA